MWNNRLDTRLLKLKRQGLSFAEIGEKIGVTRNAAIGRFQRLNGRVFPSQAERSRTRRETARLKEEVRVRKNAEAIRNLKAALAAGTDKTKAVKQAYTAGANYEVIGDVLGVSGVRVRQIAHGV